MKICPFISHMLGEVGAQTMSTDPTLSRPEGGAGPEEEVVILGYDGAQGVTVQTETKRDDGGKEDSSRLFCLKEPCRFYDKKTDGCSFDRMLERVEALSRQEPKAGKGQDKNSAKLLKELDKFWKFQTKSVSELVATISDSERKSSGEMTKLKREIDKWISGLQKQIEKIQKEGNRKELADVRSGLEALESRIKEREESIENFSTTLSEVVIGLEEAVDKVKEQMGELKATLEGMEKRIEQQNSPSSTEEVMSKTFSAIWEPQWKRLEEAIETKTAEAAERVQHSVRDQLTKLELDWEKSRKLSEDWQRRWENLEKAQKELIDAFHSEKKLHEQHLSHSQKKEARKLNNLGVSTFYNGALGEAKEQFLRAVALDPSFAEAYNNLGLVYTEMGKEEEATEAFTKAIQLDPSLPAAYNNLGYIFYKQGSYEQAIEMYNQALGKSPNSSSAYTNLGNAYFKLGKREEAREAWRKATEIDPYNERAKSFLRRLDGGKE